MHPAPARTTTTEMVGLDRVQQNASGGGAARAHVSMAWWRATDRAGRPGPDGRADARSYVRNSSALLTYFAACRAWRRRAMENSE